MQRYDESEAYLAAIIMSSDDAIISKDLKGNITSWNPAAERIFGYTQEEAVGRHITIIIPPERLEEEGKILNTLRAGDRIEHFETERRHKSGRMVPISLTVSPIRDASGTVIGASKIARDISDRIKGEQAFRDINVKKDEFLANMSHELRTPMNAVIGLSNLLNAMDLPEKARKYVDTLKLSAENLMTLINDLLDFAKIDSEFLQIEQIEFDLAEQVEKAVRVANVRAREKGLWLYAHYSPLLNRYFVGDPLRVNQILMNLLSNAVKFTEKGSVELDVSGKPNPATGNVLVTLKVTDTGIGIAPDKLASIFDKFMQADSSITRKYGGSGLGLAIVRALAGKMNGTASVESELGLGTTFTITLPLKEAQRTSMVEALRVDSAPEAPVLHKNVLLVEDYEPNVIVAEALLQQLGCDYDITQNGFEALRKFRQHHYDVILMDVQMHDLDGLEATRKIRKIESEKNLRRTPIIAMTAHVKEQDKDKCLKAGMDDFLPKPFDPAELSQKIDRYVRSGKVVPLRAAKNK